VPRWSRRPSAATLEAAVAATGVSFKTGGKMKVEQLPASVIVLLAAYVLTAVGANILALFGR
jgi:hypothetical protein